MSVNKRRIFLSRSRYQVTLMWVILLASALPTLFLCSIYFLLIHELEMVYRQTSNLQTLGGLVLDLNTALIIFLPLILILTWMLAVLVTYRIAGGLMRIERELDARVRENSTEPIKIRPRDFLQGFVDNINVLLAHKIDKDKEK